MGPERPRLADDGAMDSTRHAVAATGAPRGYFIEAIKA
jgi:hypothetical protein